MEANLSRAYRGPVRALIADLAGTTVDYGSCAPAGAFVELFARRGIKIMLSQARAPMGLHKRDHIRKIASMPDVHKRWMEAYGAIWTEEDIDSMYDEFIPLQIECLPRHGDLIPGTIETVRELRRRGIRVGVNTGYNEEMMNVVLECAAEQGFVADSAVCASHVATGRPAPWMIFRSMELLDVYPPEAVVAVGDTLPDIEAGLNAGVWSVGLAKTGNMLGLNEQEVKQLSPEEMETRLKSARDKMYQAGAHFVVDGIDDCLAVVDRINDLLASGKAS